MRCDHPEIFGYGIRPHFPFRRKGGMSDGWRYNNPQRWEAAGYAIVRKHPTGDWTWTDALREYIEAY